MVAQVKEEGQARLGVALEELEGGRAKLGKMNRVQSMEMLFVCLFFISETIIKQIQIIYISHCNNHKSNTNERIHLVILT